MATTTTSFDKFNLCSSANQAHPLLPPRYVIKGKSLLNRLGALYPRRIDEGGRQQIYQLIRESAPQLAMMPTNSGPIHLFHYYYYYFFHLSLSLFKRTLVKRGIWVVVLHKSDSKKPNRMEHYHRFWRKRLTRTAIEGRRRYM